MRMLALSVLAAAGLSGSVTAAADLKVGAEKTASQSNPWDVAFGVEFMTDYNWRGITVSARRPSVEAYVEPRYRPAADLELYAGVSGANVDLPNGSRAQIVYYAGTRPTFGPLLLDLGGYIDYPGGATFTGIGSADTCKCPLIGSNSVLGQTQSELGWTDGCNIRVQARMGRGRPDQVRAYAAELVGMMPDVLAANSGPTLASALAASRTARSPPSFRSRRSRPARRKASALTTRAT
jgi:hypothetical protein